jgi:hypothetical protein
MLALAACGEQGGGEGAASGGEAAGAAPAAKSGSGGGLGGGGAMTVEQIKEMGSKRKPGKWRMSLGMAGVPSMPPQEICITPEQLAEQEAWDPKQAGGGCPGFQVIRQGDAIVTKATCPSEAGGSTYLESKITGNFETAYRVETLIRQTPAPAGQPGEVRNFLDMQYLGPC